MSKTKANFTPKQVGHHMWIVVFEDTEGLDRIESYWDSAVDANEWAETLNNVPHMCTHALGCTYTRREEISETKRTELKVPHQRGYRGYTIFINKSDDSGYWAEVYKGERHYASIRRDWSLEAGEAALNYIDEQEGPYTHV